MKIVFRTDSSELIGTGHAMRCLTLATVLRDKGEDVFFISREHPGNINSIIAQNGFKLFELPYSPNFFNNENSFLEKQLAHSEWLGVNQEEDARQCKPILKNIQPDWLIVDHYAINYLWHKLLKPQFKRLMVIDDIADRRHECDLLLDQNYGKQPSDYLPLVPAKATLLLGTEYALLRPEFRQWRDFSLKRRYSKPELKQIMITMGGIDASNMTGQILSELKKCHLPKNTVIKVVMGSSAPWLKQVNQQAAQMSHSTEVFVGITNMAEIMANSDLAIGAAGSTSWERCCLGLPTIMVVLAENQKSAANFLTDLGAAVILNNYGSNKLSTLLEKYLLDFQVLRKMSICASQITDGNGATRVMAELYGNCL